VFVTTITTATAATVVVDDTTSTGHAATTATTFVTSNMPSVTLILVFNIAASYCYITILEQHTSNTITDAR
jgi:uracil phosphoribosyltransferase